MLAPLAGLRRRRGVAIRMVPFADLAGEVRAGDQARGLLARVLEDRRGGGLVRAGAAPTRWCCSTAPRDSARCPPACEELGCDFYAASGQKWLCGPNGLGYLYVRAELAGELPAPWPSYGVLSDSTRAFELDLHPDARRCGIGFPAPHQVEWALAALDVLEEAGIDAIHARAAELAGPLAERRSSARVAPRGRSTLVSWEDADPEATVARLRREGF